MKFLAKSTRSALAAMPLIVASCAAFTTSPLPSFLLSPTLTMAGRPVVAVTAYKRNAFLLRASNQEEVDDEIDRLKQMAAKLRAEAASLEAQQQQAMAKAAEKAFQKVRYAFAPDRQFFLGSATHHLNNFSPLKPFLLLRSISLILIRMGKLLSRNWNWDSKRLSSWTCLKSELLNSWWTLTRVEMGHCS